MKKKLLLVACVFAFTAVSGIWDVISNPDIPLTVSNKFEKAVDFGGITLKTNQVKDLGTVMTRENINRNAKQLYDLYMQGKIDIITNGNVPVKSF